MKNSTLLVVLVAVMATVAVTWLLSSNSITESAKAGFGALFGLISVSFTHFLAVQDRLSQAAAQRLQDARGLARALAAELRMLGHLWLRDGHLMVLRVSASTSEYADSPFRPAEVMEVFAVRSHPVFDANVNRLALLQELESFGSFAEGEDHLVESVVGFFDGLVDIRTAVANAVLNRRTLSSDEVRRFADALSSRSSFALRVSEQLSKFSALSESG
ncbi:MAG TPA: hypothetical protein VH814_10785 [Steroidobacteraceae bacterium]|jgi:hypothetical protein